MHVTLLAAALLEQAEPALAVGNGPALWLLTGLGWTAVAAAAMIPLARQDGHPATSSRRP